MITTETNPGAEVIFAHPMSIADDRIYTVTGFTSPAEDPDGEIFAELVGYGHPCFARLIDLDLR